MEIYANFGLLFNNATDVRTSAHMIKINSRGLTSTVLAASLFIVNATAQSITAPDTNTEPKGWDWEAVIINVRRAPQPALVLKLTNKIGGCVLWQTAAHAAGDTVTLEIAPDQAARYKIGQSIHVWVNGNAASLAHPKC